MSEEERAALEFLQHGGGADVTMETCHVVSLGVSFFSFLFPSVFN